MKRQSTTKKISKSDVRLMADWLQENPYSGIIIRLRGEEIGIVSIDVKAGTAIDDEGNTINLKPCTIPKETIQALMVDCDAFGRLQSVAPTLAIPRIGVSQSLR